MDIYEKIDLQDCPICGGPALLEEEGNHGFYVCCMDCGAFSVTMDYKSEEDKLEAAQKTAANWNTGKVIAGGVGE